MSCAKKVALVVGNVVLGYVLWDFWKQYREY